MPLDLPTHIDSFSEADVRGEILDPLLKELGYRAGDLNSIRREASVSLRYPHESLGRKDPKRDPLLRGRADYILSAGDHRNWVLEAKPAYAELTEDDVEQAYTYARHPEIRAVLFALSNGKEFRVYETDASPASAPVLSARFGEIDRRLGDLKGLLGPEGIKRNFPRLELDGHPEVAPGYRSPLRILGGYVTQSGPPETTSSVLDGGIERHSDGLLAYLDLHAPVPQIQALNDRMGTGRFEAYSSSTRLSTDVGARTRFVATESVAIERGERLFDLPHWRWVILPVSIVVSVQTTIDAHLEGNLLLASYRSQMDCQLFSARIVGQARLRVA